MSAAPHTHTPAELAALERATGLELVGYLAAGEPRTLLPSWPVRSEDVIYNANCIRVETGFFCQPTKLTSGVEAILRQVPARNYPC